MFVKHMFECCIPGSQVKDQLKSLMGAVHSSITIACQEYFEKYRRHVYVTPKSYLSFIAGYRNLYGRKLALTRELAASINSGLQKMNEAKVDVNRMKVRCPAWKL
jgi:dynein heavy chain